MRIIGILLAAIVLAPPAFAADDFVGRFTIAPIFTATDDARGTPGDGSGIAVSYGRRWTDVWSWEGTFSYSVFETDVPEWTDFYQKSVGLDFSRRLGNGSRIVPMAWFGAGLAIDDIHPDTGDTVNPYLSIAAGFTSQPFGAGGVSLRARAAYVYDDLGPGMSDLRVEIGVSIPIGRVVP